MKIQSRNKIFERLGAIRIKPFSVCALAVVFVSGCSMKEVNARRLGARWNALNVAESTQAVGRVPEDWAAGFFISTPLLENFANLSDNTEIAYVGIDAILRGTKITLQHIKINNVIGEVRATIDAAVFAPEPLGKIEVSINGNLRFVGATAASDTKSEVLFRVEPTDIEDRSHGILSLFFSKRNQYLTRLLADLALQHINESKLFIRVPVPNSLHADLKIDETMKDVAIASATATLNVSMPNTTITQRFPFTAMLPRKDGVWVVAGGSPLIKSAYHGATASLDPTMTRVLAYLEETKSPLATLPLPPSQKALQDALTTLKQNLAPTYATGPGDVFGAAKTSRKAEIYAFVSGRAIEEWLQQFETRSPADRTIAVRSTATGGHLKEAAVLKDEHLGDYQFYAELKGPDAIQGHATLNLQNTKWTQSGLNGTLTYDVQATIQTHLQIELGILDELPLLGKITKETRGLDLPVQGTLPKPDPVPVSVIPDRVEKDGASAVILAPRIGCQIIDIDLATGPHVGIRIHQPAIHQQFKPLPVIRSEEYLLEFPSPAVDPKATWTISPNVGLVDVDLRPVDYKSTGDGLFVEATISTTILSNGKPSSSEESALKTAINDRNAIRVQRIVDASEAEQQPYTCQLTRSFGIELGPANIETKAFLNTAQHVIAEAKRIIDGAKKDADNAKQKVQEAEKAANEAAAKIRNEDARKAANAALSDAKTAFELADASFKLDQANLASVVLEGGGTKAAKEAVKEVQDAAKKKIDELGKTLQDGGKALDHAAEEGKKIVEKLNPFHHKK